MYQPCMESKFMTEALAYKRLYEIYEEYASEGIVTVNAVNNIFGRLPVENGDDYGWEDLRGTEVKEYKTGMYYIHMPPYNWQQPDAMRELYMNRPDTSESEPDLVNHPPHYQSKKGIEVIDVIEAFTEDLSGLEAVCTANALKYICRWKHKNGIQDLQKAEWYLKKLIDIQSKENSNE